MIELVSNKKYTFSEQNRIKTSTTCVFEGFCFYKTKSAPVIKAHSYKVQRQTNFKKVEITKLLDDWVSDSSKPTGDLSKSTDDSSRPIRFTRKTRLISYYFHLSTNYIIIINSHLSFIEIASKSNAGRIGQFKKRLNTLACGPNKAESDAANRILRDWPDMSSETKLEAQTVFEKFCPVSNRAIRRKLDTLDATNNQPISISGATNKTNNIST